VPVSPHGIRKRNKALAVNNGPAVPGRRWLWESPQNRGCKEVRAWWLPSLGRRPRCRP
jgi:hypothetical protein